MKPQLAKGLRWRKEPFGSVAYVPSRDSFFALDRLHTNALLDVADPATPNQAYNHLHDILAGLGLLVGFPAHPTPRIAAPGLVGNFASLPVAPRPLLVNCFATAHCPLACAYCYADDLMIPYRDDPELEVPDRVVSMAESVEAMVAVVTGGDPLARPRQAADLLRKLATTKAVVLDTSGVGNLSAILSAIQETHAHLRISLDSAVREINDGQRPIRRPFQISGSSSWKQAINSLIIAVSEEVPVSVQSVLTTSNSNLLDLAMLRDLLIGLGVRKWVLHIVVKAGRARKHSSSSRTVPPEQPFLTELHKFVYETVDQGYPMEIRITNNNHARNSVLLIDTRGNLLTESASGTGKTLLARSSDDTAVLTQSFDRNLNLASHYSRYLNCNVLSTTYDSGTQNSI